MKSTPIQDLLENESITDEDEMERDISSISEDIRNSNEVYDHSSDQIQMEMASLRNQLEQMKRQQNTETTPLPTKIKIKASDMEGNIFEEIFRYKQVEDVIEIVSLIMVYVLFTLNAFVEFVDNMIPYMFYNYIPIIKGVLFVLVYRGINFFMRKLFKGNQ